MTGKKAGVLNFGREVLLGVGVGRHETGEARRVVWDDGEGEGGGGEEFVVGWERGAVVYGVDCVPRVRIVVGGRGGGRVGGGVKIHQMRYFHSWKGGDGKGRCLAVSTEDGRIIFFSTAAPREHDDKDETTAPSLSPGIPLAAPTGEIGPSLTTAPSRIKDFKILSRHLQDGSHQYLLVAGSSDGSISIWQLDPSKFSVPPSSSSSIPSSEATNGTNGTTTLNSSEAKAKPPQVGSLIGIYHTSGRITCLEAMAVTLPFKPDATDGSEAAAGDEKSNGHA